MSRMRQIPVIDASQRERMLQQQELCPLRRVPAEKRTLQTTLSHAAHIRIQARR